MAHVASDLFSETGTMASAGRATITVSGSDLRSLGLLSLVSTHRNVALQIVQPQEPSGRVHLTRLRMRFETIARVFVLAAGTPARPLKERPCTAASLKHPPC